MSEPISGNNDEEESAPPRIFYAVSRVTRVAMAGSVGYTHASTGISTVQLQFI